MEDESRNPIIVTTFFEVNINNISLCYINVLPLINCVKKCNKNWRSWN